MVVQGNNPSDELIQVLELENTKLQYTINMDNNMDMHNMGMVTNPHVRLSLTYYINQHPNTPLQIFKIIETHLADFNSKVDGVFTSRSMEPFRGEYVTVVKYEIFLRDYDHLMDGIAKMAKEKVDRDFTEALEAKLSED